MLCNCFLCRSQDFYTFYDFFTDAGSEYSVSKLRRCLSVHELFASYHEFKNSQKTIRETDYKSYLREKPIIRENGARIREVDYKTLDEYF